jgi:hypothetical protein
MAKYRITELSFIDNRLVQAGEEIETNATPANHWEPLDKKAEKDRKAFDADEVERTEAARIAAEERFLLENPANLTPATAQEIASLPQE